MWQNYYLEMKEYDLRQILEQWDNQNWKVA